MNDATAPTPPRFAPLAEVLVRWLAGALFIYLGLHKALHPVEFLKLVHQYGFVSNYWLLNAIAAAVPWFEVFCGMLLLTGVAVRGTALVLVLMLVPFTWVVWQHALALQSASHIPFCAVKFDCGCGAGEEFICWKLLENIILAAVLLWLLFGRRRDFCASPE